MYDEASGNKNFGYTSMTYSEKPTAILACDFAALIGPEPFKRWGVPALEFESGIVGERALFHWDGPDAIKHRDDLINIKNLHTFSYVPNWHQSHCEFLELYRNCQDRGKGIYFIGKPDEIKKAHEILRPEYTIYNTQIPDEAAFYELDDWLRRHV